MGEEAATLEAAGGFGGERTATLEAAGGFGGGESANRAGSSEALNRNMDGGNDNGAAAADTLSAAGIAEIIGDARTAGAAPDNPAPPPPPLLGGRIAGC